MQYSTDVRDAQNDAAVARIGASPTLEIRAGAAPANCKAPDAGVVLASGSLPVTWMQPSRDGTAQMAGPWEVRGAMDAGTGKAGGHFRIRSADGVCHMQGSFGKGGEMVPDRDLIAIGQRVVIQAFSITRGNG